MRYLLCAFALLLLAGCGNDTPPEHGARVFLDELDPDNPGEGDRMVLEQMQKAGADLSKQTDVRWYVYLPTKPEAERFLAKATATGWQVTLDQGVDGSNWLCLCSRDATPSLETIAAMRAQLVECGQGLESEIDGWEAAITK